MSKIKKVVVGAALFMLVVVVAGAACVTLSSEPRPTHGKTGARAEALADRALSRVDAESWARTGAVSWRFPMGHEHLWDRRRGLARITWGGKRVWVRLKDRQGVATEDGEVVGGDRARELVEQGYAMWANDSFWLNPVVKLRDRGTRREAITYEGEEALLVTYSSGGVTPGDAYLWLFDETGRPRAWKMWVGVLPVGGLEVSFEGWVRLETGAMISTVHRGLGPLRMELKQVRAAPTLEGLLGAGAPDPFAVLVQ